MKLETKNGVNFSGTVTELFALEAGVPTYRHGSPARTLMPRRPVNVSDGYGNTIRMPSIKAAWRFYVKIAGDARFFFPTGTTSTMPCEASVAVKVTAQRAVRDSTAPSVI